MQFFKRVLPTLRTYSTEAPTKKNLYLEYTKKKQRFTNKQKNQITILQHNILNKQVNDIALNKLFDNPGSKTKTKRIGRGVGTGKGRHATRGMMGQKSRPSSNIPNGFQGGQTRIYRRVPKFGFKNKMFQLRYEAISLEKIQYFIDTGRISSEGTINMKTLYDAGAISKIGYPGIKLTSNGMAKFSAKIDIEIPRVTKKALKTIESLGGSVRSVYYSRGALIVMRKQPPGVYNFEEVVAKMAMPPPKLFHYYMREDVRGYLCDTNPVHPLRDVVPAEEAKAEREKGTMRLLNWKKAVAKKALLDSKKADKKKK